MLANTTLMASKSRYEQIVTGDDRRVGSRGEIVIPQQLRKKYGIERGDTVGVTETDDGTIEIVPPPNES